MATQFVIKRDGSAQEARCTRRAPTDARQIRFELVQRRLRYLADGFAMVGKKDEEGRAVSSRIG